MLLAPSEKPPYLQREMKGKVWKQLNEFVIFKIKPDKDLKD